MSVAINPKHQSSALHNFLNQFKRPLKTFHHHPDDVNQEFVIDSIEDKPGFYQITAQGPRVKPGESIEIEQFGQYLTYQVDNIEYYTEPSDMWMAILHKI